MSVGTLPAPPPVTDIRVLEAELLSLAGHIAAAECRFLQGLAEFDDRKGWAGPGIRSCAHWLSWRAGMSLRTAAEYVRVAHALQRLPRITAAFAAGRISYSKVRALTRVTGSDTAALTRIAAAIAAGDPDLRHVAVADAETAEQVLSTSPCPARRVMSRPWCRRSVAATPRPGTPRPGVACSGVGMTTGRWWCGAGSPPIPAPL